MSNLASHEMHLERVHPSSAEEWFCPTCGRRFLMRWEPECERLDILVLNAGDEHINHVGSTGGLRMGTFDISAAGDEPTVSAELRAALDEALDDIDFDDWPESDETES